MNQPMTQKQKIILGAVALVLAISGLSSLMESRQGQGGMRAGQYGSNQYGSGQYNSRQYNSGQYGPGQDGSDSWQAPNADQGSAGQFQDGAPAYPTQDGMPAYPNGSYDAGQGAMANGGASPDMGSDAVTNGYWERQATQDGVMRDMDNQIKDQVTLRNPTTGETMQGDAGSDNYYQSPTVDNQMGAQTIVGADAGATPPSDSTQLSVVTGSDSGAASTSSESP